MRPPFDAETQAFQATGQLCPVCAYYKRGEDGTCVDCGADWPLGDELDGLHCPKCGEEWVWHGRDEKQRVCDECRFAS